MEILKQHLKFDKVNSVLDYGGDRGQYIPDELSHADRYVYEVSDVDLLPGVHRISRMDGFAYDLLMCCQVLEHVAYPRKVLNEIRLMAHHDSVVYVEVPYEVPGRAGKARRWQSNINMVMGNPLVLLDAAKLVYGPRYTMHEHVNYFTPLSIETLLEKTGFKVQAIYLKSIDCGWTVTDNICCVAKPSF